MRVRSRWAADSAHKAVPGSPARADSGTALQPHASVGRSESWDVGRLAAGLDGRFVPVAAGHRWAGLASAARFAGWTRIFCRGLERFAMKYTVSIEIALPREKRFSCSLTPRTCRSGCGAWCCMNR
ncbi:hypothetical protein GCM10009745_37580 [Kribbella yunnanensis]|uniref:Uncharacterized protein n=1 Tax=Kribbella yunnanensis TaxID=190194 RepID=A0ABP4TJD3_9ACTN